MHHKNKYLFKYILSIWINFKYTLSILYYKYIAIFFLNNIKLFIIE